MTFIPFFRITKIFGFYKGFPNNICFSLILGSKTENFVNFEEAILYSVSFYILTLFFDEFLNIEPILVKIDVKWPHKNVDFSKNFPTDFNQI